MKKEKKLPIGLSPEFTDKINAASVDEIKAEMIQTQKGIEDSKEFKKTKTEILEARENLSQIVGPINDAIKSGNNRLKYMVDRLKEMGAL